MLEINKILIMSLLQFFIALSLVNVWLVRFNKSTKYRGAGAQNMKEEFTAYGLPAWSVYVVGFLKISIASGMIFTLFKPNLIHQVSVPLLIVLSVLMLGAISMHIKVKDPLIKILPAILVLLMSTSALYLALYL